MTEPRAFATSATMGSTIYVFGGKGSPLSQVRLKSCEKLDTLKSPMNWERIAPMGTGRGDAGAAVVDGKVLVVGGFSGYNFLSSVEVYNPSTNTWQMGPSLKAPRSGMGVAVLEGTVYVAGGKRGTGRLRSVERLAPGAKRCTVYNLKNCTLFQVGESSQLAHQEVKLQPGVTRKQAACSWRL